jgi:hypothetical protein
MGQMDGAAAFELLRPHYRGLTLDQFTRPFADETSRKIFEGVVETLLNRIYEGRTVSFVSDR